MPTDHSPLPTHHLPPPWGEPPPETWRRAWRGVPIPAWRYLSQVTSTQDLARIWAEQGAQEGCLVYAERQTRGRGRAGRTWRSRPGASLTFSLILRPRPQEAPYLSRLSGWAAVAVSTVLETRYRLRPEIKWPNDVLLAGKKVAGILVEAEWRGGQVPAYVIVGIGVNVTPAAYAGCQALPFPATALQEHVPGAVSRPDLLVALWRALMQWRPWLGHPRLVQAWEARLAYRGQEVWVHPLEGQAYPARLLGLTPDGRLRVRLGSGRVQTLTAVAMLRPRGPGA